MARRFKIATAAGTFDHFHKGHKQFLLSAFELADIIYVAITSDEFAKSSRQIDSVTPFEERKKIVEVFLLKHKVLGRSKIIELYDIYGPTLEEDCPIQAIVVTEKTLYGGELINKLRAKKGLSPLQLVTVTYIKASDGGELSSSRIRAGEIDREGKLYIEPSWLTKTLILPDSIRPMLQKPIGILIKGSEENLNEAVVVIKQVIHPGGGNYMIVTVGDVVTQSFNAGNIPMDVAIVDFQVKREAKFTNLHELGFTKDKPDAIVENPKGTLTGETFKAVQKAMRHLGGGRMDSPEVEGVKRTPFVIRVIGEEDLATLAAVLAAPLGTHVFYGQPRLEQHPNEGIVQVVVTEEKKAEIREIVSKFTS